MMLGNLLKEQVLGNPNVIARLDQTIRAFGKYLIKPDQGDFFVYRGATFAAQVSSARIALSWCIADKLGKHELAREIQALDRQIGWRESDIIYHSHTQDATSDPIKKSIASDRLHESRARSKQARERLSKCVDLAKYWQLKGFRDETARIRIKNQSTAKSESF
jgi:hypothetical protein